MVYTADSDQVSDGLYIGQVAEMLGVTTTMIRQWEKHGFIKAARTQSGYRVYPMDQIQRMQTVRDLVKSGVNPAGIHLTLQNGELGFPGPPPSGNPTSVGARLQRLRTAKKISLRGLAARTQLSASYLSAIERSISNPSVAVLLKLVAALGTNLVEVLGGEPLDNKLVVKGSERRSLDQRIPGVEIQQLFRVDTVLESLLFIIQPGAASGESYQHEGEEFLFVVEGNLEVVLDETERFSLETGDSMTYASHRPHRFANTGSTVAAILWVNTPPTF
ncbi:cupin domain-containing protein [Phyllobacterium lublinensis]|jgi:transcriptional regulator with XRE-family HTH domain|uniref:cupin domain-containing protein n=1 Tax=Phyllobacterium lublinensis TaxID=2875708 RepID=UPI001CCEDC84|nr:cupin domain-containing protein [Phyllobacterium sp. 2063]MBZ9653180.1 cupin domain-containing protein [Phyllobacterium sp. 2063]